MVEEAFAAKFKGQNFSTEDALQETRGLSGSILSDFSSDRLQQFLIYPWSKRSELETGASVFLAIQKAAKLLLDVLDLSGKTNFCGGDSSPGASRGDGRLRWVSFVSSNGV